MKAKRRFRAAWLMLPLMVAIGLGMLGLAYWKLHDPLLKLWVLAEKMAVIP